MSYTQSDHLFRGEDQYAQGKYDITLKWLLDIGHKGKMLNIGCGAGDFNQAAAAHGFSVKAYEPDEAACSIARQNAPRNVEVLSGGLNEAASAEKADLIVMHDVLEHIKEDHKAVAQVKSTLNPGGILIVTVPACNWLFGRHDEELLHYRRYGRRQLVQLLSSHGLQIERIRWYGFLFIPITFLFSVWLRRDYPKPSGRRGLAYWVIRSFVAIEKCIRPPLGTSLIVQARAR